MRTHLGTEFTDNMKALLGNDADRFFASYEEDPVCSLRVNSLKKFNLREYFPDVDFRPVPWCDGTYYYPSSFKAGKTAAHLAGAYYVQEASATFPVTALGVKKGDKVLDLCAAPGGKSTHIASLLGGTGLLVSNEIVPSRANVLSGNIERMGVKNAVVLNEDPRNLVQRFSSFFDKILVDAPCSGEGMFRKNPEAALEWTKDSPASCAERQFEILSCAISMLGEGGTLVYSTCTFNAKENEETVAHILRAHDDIQLCPIETDVPQPVIHGTDAPASVIDGTVRIMPHLAEGEGHFCARFVKTRGEAPSVRPLAKKRNPSFDKAFAAFSKKYLRTTLSANLFFGEYGYSAPEDCPDLDRLRVLRAGIQLGKLIKDRFEPSHSLALALSADQAINVLDLKEGGKETVSYLMGETLPCDLEGWTLVTVNSLPLGWGKASDGVLKNRLPKGLRINR